MIKLWVLALIFLAIGVILFFVGTALKPVMFKPLNETLYTQDQANPAHLFQKNVNTLFNYYDATMWFFLITPVVFILIQVLRREQTPQVSSGGEWSG